jgi:hypothetical protein
VAQLVGLSTSVATGVFDPVAPAEPLIQPFHQLWAVS